VGADLFYFFLKHRAIVLGSAALRVCLTLALILPSTLSIELSDADNPVNLTPDFSAQVPLSLQELAPVGDRLNLCYIF
jgi:hypothetical protein